MSINKKKVWLFIGLTYFFSWILVVLFLALGGSLGSPYSLLLTVPFMYIPLIMAIIVQKIYKEEIKQPLAISFKFNRWFLVAWILPIVITIFAIGIASLFPGVEFSPTKRIDQINMHLAKPLKTSIIWFSILLALVLGPTINALVAFGEELGWRGFLQKEFGAINFWKSSFLIGVIWGAWHFPIILLGHNFPQNPVAGVFLMIIFTIIASPVFSYIRLQAKSVIASSIFHGTFNATAGLTMLTLIGGNDITIGAAGLVGMIAFIIIDICIWIFDRHISKTPLFSKPKGS